MLRDSRDKVQIGQFSSFMTVEKTIAEIVDALLRNERLKKLLFYTDKHALRLPAITAEQTLSLLNEQIKTVPKLKVDKDTKPYIIISLDEFTPLSDMTTFRYVSLTFDIFCDYDHWQLDDFKLRPYSIAGEIDAIINKSHFGFGIADFIGAKQLPLNEHLGGVTLYYRFETMNDDVQEYKK